MERRRSQRGSDASSERERTTLSVVQLCVIEMYPDLIIYMESPGSPSRTMCSPAS